MKMRSVLAFLIVLVSVFGAGTTPASAAAFYLQEQSASGLGDAYAGAAADTPDVSTVYYNPAGLVDLDPRPQIQAGTHILVPRASFSNNGTTVGTVATGGVQVPLAGGNGGNPYDPAAIPNLFAAFPATKDNRVWVGIGVTAPFGLANEYNRDFVGRYDSLKSELTTINVSPSVAYKATDWLSVGFGVDFQHADAEIESAIPNPATGGAQSEAVEGTQNLAGDDMTIGFNAGAIVKPTPDTRIGLHYRSAISHDVRGRLIIKAPAAAGGAFTRIGGSAALDLPAMTSLGVSHRTGDWTWLAGATYTEWSRFNSIPVTLATGATSETAENYNDTWSFAAGARYRANDQWTIKGGVQYDPTPTDDAFRSSRVPDGDRIWVAGGANYKLNDRVCIDLSCAYVNVSEEDINLTRSFPTAGGSVAQIRGKTEGDVGIVSTAVNVKF